MHFSNGGISECNVRIPWQTLIASTSLYLQLDIHIGDITYLLQCLKQAMWHHIPATVFEASNVANGNDKSTQLRRVLHMFFKIFIGWWWLWRCSYYPCVPFPSGQTLITLHGSLNCYMDCNLLLYSLLFHQLHWCWCTIICNVGLLSPHHFIRSP